MNYNTKSGLPNYSLDLPQINASDSGFNITYIDDYYDGQSLDMAFKGDFAFLANGFGGIEVFEADVSENLHKVFEFDPGYDISHLQIKDDYLYASAYENGLVICDISNPFAMREINKIFESTTSEILSILIEDHYLYATFLDQSLKVFDLSTPTEPWLVGLYNIGEYFDQMRIEGDLLYLSSYDETLVIKLIDISDPTKLRKIKDLDISNYIDPYDAYEIDYEIQNNILYVLALSAELLIFNVSDIQNIILENVVDMPYNSYSICVHNDHLVMYEWNYKNLGEITTYDLSDCLNPFLLVERKTKTMEPIRNMIIKENTLYLLQGQEGFCLYDLSDPGEIPFKFCYDYDIQINEYLVDFPYLYTFSELGMEIFNLNASSGVEHVAIFNHSGYYNSFAKYKEVIFLLSYEELFIIDVSNSSQPTLVQKITELEQSRKLAIFNETIAIASNNYETIDNTIKFYKLTSENQLNYLNEIEISGYISEIKFEEQLLLVLDEEQNLFAIDTSNIENLKLYEDFLGINFNFWNLQIQKQGEFLYVLYGAGIEIYEISDLENPIFRTYISSDQFSALYVSDNYLFILKNPIGRSYLLVYDVTKVDKLEKLVESEIYSLNFALYLNQRSLYLISHWNGISEYYLPDLDLGDGQQGLLANISGYPIIAWIFPAGVVVFLLGNFHRKKYN